MGVEIPVNRSFQRNQSPVNCQSRHFCQLSELTTIVSRATSQNEDTIATKSQLLLLLLWVNQSLLKTPGLKPFRTSSEQN